jgi:pimeloyl-ACP methyl ester carboxylesterase
VLDSLGLRRVTVIGHSLGGSVAISLAAQRPDPVGSLVAAEPHLDPGAGMLGGPRRHVSGEPSRKDLAPLRDTGCDVRVVAGAGPVPTRDDLDGLVEAPRRPVRGCGRDWSGR